ncbi:zinc-finger domain-containing protein [Halobacillus karajensis]|uniref:Uncharacterized protein n=1 Tax=Halobacillus karajensis TaxID=195088 RepID=A0A059NUY5_9BACI|nr:zinc-finger domain-containing protein [Halobacillus karajensis]CDQ22609.1 hypothetical protein BN983_00822 [Halobacillus karajensis]CDQ26091.1 hypothetical protein BN981_00302 [Halobacillus karajensis]
MGRLETLKAIDQVQEKHCSKCTLVAWMDKLETCHDCPVGKNLQELGSKLGGDERSYQPILDKGFYMTFSDIDYLRGLGVPWDVISDHIGWNKSFVQKLYSDRNKALKPKEDFKCKH